MPTSKPLAPQCVPLANIPIGRPRQIVAVDIYEVPVSSGTTYIYWWCKCTAQNGRMQSSARDQTANRITEELIKLFATYDLPEILYSDQGRNFESAILSVVSILLTYCNC